MAQSLMDLPLLIATSQSLVTEHGAKHWTRLRGDRIHLVDPITGDPEDLIGHLLARLGVAIPTNLSTASVKKLWRRGIIELSDDTYEYLLALQDAQDDGCYWGEAALLAELWMIDLTMPWNQKKQAVA